MRVTMIGTGYVGLVSGACFADFGNQVICVDKDAAKIDRLAQGECPIFEPFLDALIARNTQALDLERVRAILRKPVVVDLRNIYKPADMTARGFTYVSIGRAS